MRKFSAHGFSTEQAWGSDLLSDFGNVTVRMHWTDKPYRWHQNTGKEVFVVLDGTVDMHVREHGVEKIIHLTTGEGVSVDNGDEHVAHPVGEARILVIELKGSV